LQTEQATILVAKAFVVSNGFLSITEFFWLISSGFPSTVAVGIIAFTTLGQKLSSTIILLFCVHFKDAIIKRTKEMKAQERKRQRNKRKKEKGKRKKEKGKRKKEKGKRKKEKGKRKDFKISSTCGPNFMHNFLVNSTAVLNHHCRVFQFLVNSDCCNLEYEERVSGVREGRARKKI
jgi:hypothetical protein